MKAHNPSARPAKTGISRLRSLLVSVPIVFLAAFHGALFVRRIGDATITSPLVLGRWAFAAALLGGIFLARRVLSRPGQRRSVIVFWLLAAILHLFVPAGAHPFDGHYPAILLIEAGLAVAPALLVLGALVPVATRGVLRAWRSTDLEGFAFARSPWQVLCADRAPPLS